MNAAYLMLTTAWLAGQPATPPAGGAPAATPPAQAPVVSAPIGGGCGGGGCGGGCGCATDSCCEQRPGLCARIKALFQRNNCCDSCSSCQQTCCAPAKPVCCPAPAPTCCAPAPCNSCNSCNDCCEKPGLLARLKARFHRSSDCCDSGCGSSCGSCGCGGAIGATTVAPAETIPTKPKEGEGGRKMPSTGSVMHSMPTIVTPVVAPRLSSEQPF